MRRHERERMKLMAAIKQRELSQVQAAQFLEVGYRQTKRIWRRSQAEGDAGLVQRLRGQPGLRRKPPALRTIVLARAAEERYAGFGPTLLAEELAKEGLLVDHDTVRGWLLAAGQQTRAKRGSNNARHRAPWPQWSGDNGGGRGDSGSGQLWGQQRDACGTVIPALAKRLPPCEKHRRW